MRTLLTIVGLTLYAAPAAAATPTFAKDVAPILYKNCVECHRQNAMAPMPLMTYDEARPWARAIKQKVVAREMPPWASTPTIPA
jgi:mono/diheme cytochrome c family protein